MKGACHTLALGLVRRYPQSVIERWVWVTGLLLSIGQALLIASAFS